jgi:hypothetical protein
MLNEDIIHFAPLLGIKEDFVPLPEYQYSEPEDWFRFFDITATFTPGVVSHWKNPKDFRAETDIINSPNEVRFFVCKNSSSKYFGGSEEAYYFCLFHELQHVKQIQDICKSKRRKFKKAVASFYEEYFKYESYKDYDTGFYYVNWAEYDANIVALKLLKDVFGKSFHPLWIDDTLASVRKAMTPVITEMSYT